MTVSTRARRRRPWPAAAQLCWLLLLGAATPGGCVRAFDASRPADRDGAVAADLGAAAADLGAPGVDLVALPDTYPWVDSFLVPDSGCPTGFTQCGQACVDLATNHEHCGKCNRACAAGQNCAGNTCVCLAGGLCAGCCEGSVCRPLSAVTPGLCGNGGKACKGCDDGLTCTANGCSTVGECVFAVQLDACRIGGACYKSGEMKGACQVCDPSISQATWAPASGCVSTLGGLGKAGYIDGLAEKAMFDNPGGVIVNITGNTLHLADTSNHRIRILAMGKVATVAGTGKPTFFDGPVASASFNTPLALARYKTGPIYVADTKNHRIRKIEAGKVKTVAGAGKPGFMDGPAGQALFNAPAGIAVDSKGAIYVADSLNHRIRVIHAGKVSTVAGTGKPGFSEGPGLQSMLNTPSDVAVTEKSGTILVHVADTGNHRIRMLVLGILMNVAGQDTAGYKDGKAADALFSKPRAVAVDSAGAIFVADAGNHRVRKINAGGVTTVAGSGAAGSLNGPNLKAQFGFLGGIAVDGTGRIFVTDQTSHSVRMIVP